MTSDETLSRDEALERERTGMLELGVTGYAWEGEGANSTLLVPMAGRLHVSVGTDPTRIQPLPGIEGARGAQLSPDGSLVSYTADGDLYVVPLRDGRPRRLTDDAEPGVFNGLAEFIASEEFQRFDGAWWSADSSAIAFAHVDERGVPSYVIRHDPGHPPVEEVYRYPFPGGPNAQVSLRVASVAGHGWREVELDMRPDDYLARVVSHPAGGWLAAVLSRDQRSLAWYRVASDGSAERRWVEATDAWTNVDDHTRVLPDGRLLRSSERSGFRHLELRAPSGELERVLTAGEWVVTDLVAVSATRGEALFVATRDGVLERHL
jgi:dipeptidyl-peptidase-4